MFTGLIEQMGVVKALTPLKQGISVIISHQFPTLSMGESIAVDGVCLTVTDFTDTTFSCELSPETLLKTHFLELKEGHKVNLERCLTLSKPLGGHIVLGHVDETLTVEKIINHQDFNEVVFTGTLHPEWLIEKGSIAINGISLTINDLQENSIYCMIVPHTNEVTTIQSLEVGSMVNVEYDYFAKIVTKHNVLMHKQLEENANVD